MNPDYARILRELLREQQIASLGTLHNGQPFVSMVPFAILPEGRRLVIHVSTLASHTKDMLLNPDVSLLVTAPSTPDIPAQALARATIQGKAAPCPDSGQDYAEAKATYLAKFPTSAQMFGFADFSLFTIVPISIRLVGGFAQAKTLSAAVLAEVLGKDQG